MSKPSPNNRQELFNYAIDRARIVSSEYGVFTDHIHLYAWAETYAQNNGLTLPDLEVG